MILVLRASPPQRSGSSSTTPNDLALGSCLTGGVPLAIGCAVTVDDRHASTVIDILGMQAPVSMTEALLSV